MLKTALNYNKRNWQVMPVRPKPSKHPCCFYEWSSLQTRRQTKEGVKHAFDCYPKASIGIITGELSDLTIIDIDTKDKNKKITQELVSSARQLLKNLPPTLTVQTPSKGYHLYYKYTPNLKNSSKDIHPQADIRSQGGFVFAPPTKDPRGSYKFITPIDHPIVPFPTNSPFLNKQTEKINPLVRLKGVPCNNRNTNFTKLFGTFLAFVARYRKNKKTLTQEEIILLQEFAIFANSRNTPPMEHGRMVKTFNSILSRETNHKQNIKF